MNHFLALGLGGTEAIAFTHFFNLGSSGEGSYLGSYFPMMSADLVTVNFASSGAAQVGLNVPLKLIVQADPHLAITFRAGYSAIFVVGGGESGSDHFLPIGVDVMVSPTRRFDIGASFTLVGYLTNAGSDATVLTGGYAGLRFADLWLRFRIG